MAALRNVLKLFEAHLRILPNEEGAILMNHIEVAPSLNKDDISNDGTIPPETRFYDG